jgi:hypothetical protein
VLAAGVDERDEAELAARVEALIESRLAAVARSSPSFAAALRCYRRARSSGDEALAEGILAWVAGEPNVAASVKRAAGVRGEIDHFAALGNLQGLLLVLREHKGLLVVLDEIETLQRVRGDVRERGLNALRQLIDEIDSGRFPGLYLLITGTPAFYDGPQGAQRLAPLAQRLHVDFGGDPRFDNPRNVQIRLTAFDFERLAAVGRRVRDIYAAGAGGGSGSAGDPGAAERIRTLVDDRYVEDLAGAVAGELGGRIGIVPRVFLRKLVGDVLDRVDQFEDFRPREHYALTITDSELTLEEREARRAPRGPDDIPLKLP